jgi:hypothetical protein
MDEPARQENGGAPEKHLLGNPLVWLLFQGVEFAILVFVVLPFLESVLPHGWPEGVYIGIWLALLIGLVAINHAIRRRFVPR